MTLKQSLIQFLADSLADPPIHRLRLRSSLFACPTSHSLMLTKILHRFPSGSGARDTQFRDVALLPRLPGYWGGDVTEEKTGWLIAADSTEVKQCQLK